MSCLYIRNKWRESIGLTMILHVYMGIAKRQNNVTYFVWSQFKYKMAWLGLPFPSHSHSLSVCLYTIQTHDTAPDSCLIGYIICIRCVCILCIHIDRVSFFCFTSWIPKATQFLIYAYCVCVCVNLHLLNWCWLLCAVSVIRFLFHRVYWRWNINWVATNENPDSASVTHSCTKQSGFA